MGRSKKELTPEQRQLRERRRVELQGRAKRALEMVEQSQKANKLRAEGKSEIEKRQKIEREAGDRRRRTTAKREVVLATALDAAAQNNYPDVEASDDLDIIKMVDPAEEFELEQVGQGPPMTKRRIAPPRMRVISLREDPVGRMAKRGQLGDSPQRDIRLRAARYYENLHARAEIANLRSLDLTRDMVDGERFFTPDTDGRRAASRQLAKIDDALGEDGVEIARGILIHKGSIATLARALGRHSKREELYFGRRFHECLDCIARSVGLAPGLGRTRQYNDRYAIEARLTGSAHAAGVRANAEDAMRGRKIPMMARDKDGEGN